MPALKLRSYCGGETYFCARNLFIKELKARLETEHDDGGCGEEGAAHWPGYFHWSQVTTGAAHSSHWSQSGANSLDALWSYWSVIMSRQWIRKLITLNIHRHIVRHSLITCAEWLKYYFDVWPAHMYTLITNKNIFTSNLTLGSPSQVNTTRIFCMRGIWCLSWCLTNNIPEQGRISLSNVDVLKKIHLLIPVCLWDSSLLCLLCIQGSKSDNTRLEKQFIKRRKLEINLPCQYLLGWIKNLY